MTAPLIANLTPEALAALPEHRQAVLRYLWPAFARPPQIPPEGDWLTWLYLAGRGAGKTRAAAEWIRKRVVDEGAKRIALVGRTTPDVRQIMIEGESGLLNVFPPSQRPAWVPSKRELRFHTGALAIGNVITLRREPNVEHPTMKPVALLETVLETTPFAETVYDPFAGSGTTIIAAERQGRTSWAMGLEPRYVDASVKRWEDYTGSKAHRE